MTDAKPDLQPSERKVLDSLLALGEATAAKVGEHAGLAYSTTTPKLRKLETLELAERFRSDVGQTLWRATAATGGEAPRGSFSSADQPAHSDESGQADAGAAAPTRNAAQPNADAAPNAPIPAVPDTGTTTAQSSTASAAVRVADPQTPQPGTPHWQTSEVEAPDAAGHEESISGAPHDTTAAEGLAPARGDDTPGGVAAAKPTPKRKRPAGALEASVLAILQGDPLGQYTVNDLRKAVDKADAATGYPAASAGAIANALDKLTGKGQAVTVPAKYATFQAAPAS